MQRGIPTAAKRIEWSSRSVSIAGARNPHQYVYGRDRPTPSHIQGETKDKNPMKGEKDDDGTDGNKQRERQGAPERADRDEDTPDRVATRVGGCAAAAPREGKGLDPLP